MDVQSEQASFQESGVAQASRKNGKAASCEPCRKAKVRCDHTRPICVRCRRRGIEARCYYHPAPLTKQPAPPPVLSPPPSRHQQIPIASAAQSPQDVAPSSSRSTIVNNLQPTLSSTANSTVDSSLDESQSRSSTIQGDTALQSVRNLVDQLRQLRTIDQLLKRYYSITPAATVPAAFIMPALADLYTTWAAASDREAWLDQIAEQTLASTKSFRDVEPGMSLADFSKLHYANNSFRIELIGIIYTIAARSSLSGLTQNTHETRSSFAQTMFASSNLALALAREHVVHVTDALIWLQYENLLLTTALLGDANLASWRRLGDLATDIMTLGLNRDASTASIPFFLVEMRRRTYSSAYAVDKFLATLVERPPRISKRYSDCQIPLDLSDDELLAVMPPAELSSQLDDAGWRIGASYSGAAWIRLRYVLASFREEAMEFDFRPLTSQYMQDLNALSRRSQEMWNSVPAHLRYSPDCWESGLATSTCLMLTTAYLSYLQLDFQIQRHLERSDPKATMSLLRVADRIVATILQLGASRSRASFLSHDFGYIILSYGLPSAMRLADALARPGDLPADLSRAALIRALSVFVSNLESLHDLGEMNKAISTQSASNISQALDRVLAVSDVAATLEKIPTPSYTHYNPSSSTLNPTALDLPARSPGVNLSLDPSQWATDLDWTSFSNDWIKF